MKLTTTAVIAGALAVGVPATVKADIGNRIFPNYTPACAKCATWETVPANISKVNIWGSNGVPPADIAKTSACLMPAATAGEFECDGCTTDVVTNSFQGPWCYCEDTQKPAYCEPPISIPTQINVQVATGNVAVVSWVTFEETQALPAQAEAMFGLSEEDATTGKVWPGITHYYKAVSVKEGKNYFLHFVRIPLEKERSTYFYRVRSGAANAKWSEVHSFRATYTSGITRFAFYGDMGHSLHNNMGNMLEDCKAGKIDFIVHAGDHAYDMGNANDRRGDAYMGAFQETLATCPWIPIIGNHEANDGDAYQRYENMTWGETLKESPSFGVKYSSIKSTATSALGELLTKGTMYGAGYHGAAQGGVPSNTSRFFSTNVGLVHIAGLDLNRLDDAQLAWLDEDLAAVDRTKTPWVVVSSHFPLHHGNVAANAGASASFYTGEVAERFATSGHDFVAAHCDETGNCEETVAEFQAVRQGGLEPLLHKYGVELYAAGHVHDYCSTWPICYNNQTGSTNICMDAQGSPIKSFINSKGTVHVTDGNGGVPGVSASVSLKECGTNPAAPWCRTHGTGGAYGRVTIYNTTHMQYDHVQNVDGKVTDSILIVTDTHGPY